MRDVAPVLFFQENVGFFFKADDRWLFMGQLGWCSFSSALQKVSLFHWGKADLVSYLAETTLISGMVMSIYLGMSFPLLDVNLECLFDISSHFIIFTNQQHVSKFVLIGYRNPFEATVLPSSVIYSSRIGPHWSSILLQLVVSTHPKHSQIGSSIVGLNINNMSKSPQNGAPTTVINGLTGPPINGLKKYMDH